MDEGKRVGPSKQTFREAAEDWLVGAKAEPPVILNRSGTPYKPSALRGIEADLRRVLLPRWGAHRISDIDSWDVQRLVDELVGQGLSASRARNIVNAARPIFTRAIREKQITITPCAGLAAGLRSGELQGLKWQDVEFLPGTGALGGWLHVNHSWDRVAGLIETKSKSGRRRVPFPRPWLSERLEAHAERRPSANDEHHVFPGRFGPDIPFRDVDGRVRAAVRVANAERAERNRGPLTELNLHTSRGENGRKAARHTYGGFLRDARISESDQQEYLGHSRASTQGVTARYTHSNERDFRDVENMKLLAAYLNRVANGIEDVPDEDAMARDLDKLVAMYGADEVERRLAERRAVEVEA